MPWSASRCPATASGADRNGEWLVSSVTTLLQGNCECMARCAEMLMAWSAVHSMYTRGMRPQRAAEVGEDFAPRIRLRLAQQRLAARQQERGEVHQCAHLLGHRLGCLRDRVVGR